MEVFEHKDLPGLFQGVADIFEEKKDELCEMDANMGDGDLGLTMQKGFSAFPRLLSENAEPEDIGKTLFKAGMKMAGLVPSTMGTLMASGIMEGGKLLKGKSRIEVAEFAGFLKAFAEGVQKRGKCQAGERTILDALLKGAERAEESAGAGGSLEDLMQAACEGAKEGVEATKDMVPKHGKAAVFAAKAKGVPDQGAMAGLYLLEGMRRFFC
ncbi:MAG: dihydroxyacetone kinase subunit L [Johnsonella sp.]|nr:dihydroxyacetone kinase subunit L [Johnsonella sp.]